MARTPRRRSGSRAFYRGLTDVSSLTPQQFEEYISFLMQELGYKTERRGYVRDPDGGVDVDAWKDGHHYLVQCKLYQKSRVNHSHVRDLIGAVTLEQAHRGYLVTTGQFTPAAVRAAGQVDNIELVGPDVIAAWQEQAGLRQPVPAAGQLGSLNNVLWRLFLLVLVLVCGVIWGTMIFAIGFI